MKAYGGLLVQKIRHKHTLARNYFSKMSTMENYFKPTGNQEDKASGSDDVFDEREEEDISGGSTITTPNSVSVSTMID